MAVGMLAFSIVIILFSAVIGKMHENMDKAEIATYIVLISWGSLLFGLFLSRFAG